MRFDNRLGRKLGFGDLPEKMILIDFRVIVANCTAIVVTYKYIDHDDYNPHTYIPMKFNVRVL